MKRIPVYILILALWLAGAAVAEEVRGLYEAEVPVADQQNEARQQAMRAGLAEVLVRITGQSAVAQDPAVADLLANAPRYVQQYRYRPIAATTATPAALGLWLSFDANSVGQALRARGQPVWGSARPLLLVWLAVDGGAERRLVAAAELSAWSGLEAAARRRGVPLRLPLLDLEDQTRVTASDVWGDFPQPVLNASARYRPQAVLSGRLYQTAGSWHVNWTLHSGNSILRWDNSGSLDQVLAAGVDASADALALRFAHVVDQGPGTVVALRVAEVTTLNDYARLLAYLGALSGVVGVQVAEVDATEVQVHLTLEVASAAVVRTIGLGRTLAPVSTGTTVPMDDAQTTLHYRLLP